MATCSGRLKSGAKCPEPLYRCLVCNIVGCKQPEPNTCSKQGYVKEVCIKCGSDKNEIV